MIVNLPSWKISINYFGLYFPALNLDIYGFTNDRQNVKFRFDGY